jgi:hypothetical protein
MTPAPAPAWQRPARAIRLVAGLAVSALAVLGLAACASDGRELRAPTPDQTTTSASPTTTAVAGNVGTTPATAAQAMRVTSETFAEGGQIPDVHTCRGDDLSPPLFWSDVPSGTVEVAVVVRDLDAGGFVHWVIAGLPGTTGGVAQGTVPEGAVEATNGFDRLGWAGPCPSEGTHHYEIRVYALSGPSGVEPGQDGEGAAELVELAPSLSSAALSGTVAAG